MYFKLDGYKRFLLEVTLVELNFGSVSLRLGLEFP